MSDPEGGAIAVEYLDANHPYYPTHITDKRGGKWEMEYDPNGNVIKKTNPNKVFSTIEYKDGLPVAVKDVRGNDTQLNFDADYNLTEIKESNGAVTTYKYDGLGQNIQTTNPKGAVQNLFYDPIGRVIKVHDFDGNIIDLEYDGIDNLIHYKDAHKDVHYSYSGLWKMTSRSEAGFSKQFHYDTEERLVRILNEKKIAYHFQLDDAGHVVAEKGFDQKIRSYVRDANGQVIESKLPSGKKTQFSYDKQGRVTEIQYNDGSSQKYDYDSSGLLTKAVNENSTVSLERNIFGQITKETVNGKEINSSFDEFGRRINLQSSLGANIDFAIDGLGQLERISAMQGPAAPETSAWEADFKYDKMGLEVERLMSGGIQHHSERDSLGRLTRQTVGRNQKTKRTRKYQWGVNDRLNEIIDSQNGSAKYQYDKRGYLTQTQYENGTTENRVPDKVGNLYEDKGKQDRSYGLGGMLEKKGSQHYKYDEDGFLIEKYKKGGGLLARKKDKWQYEWNDAGMLENVIRPDGEIVSFEYDALGRRLRKTFKYTSTNWLWDGNVPLHEWKENSRGEILSNSGVGSDGVITWVFEENSFIPAAKLKENKKYSILADHLGTPTSMYNEEGESVWERSLDSFGRIKEISKGSNSSCPFMYQGQYFDAEINLAYNRFRYYCPEDGRYISQDPIGLDSGEYGLYNYVGDPNDEIDIFGLSIYSQRRRAREKGKHTRNSEYPHGNDKKVREEIIKKHTNNNGDIIDPETGDIIPPDKVSIEHKEKVSEHWNSRGRFQTKEQRKRWYNKKSNLTVKEVGKNKGEGNKNRVLYSQKTGKNYSN